jgi:predicted DsbA family dithiol-disulfide isomerase
VPFKGTYREQGWRRCAQMTEADGTVYTPWPHGDLPGWSLPALRAAKCLARQGDDVFARGHAALFRAFFTESRDIADAAVLAAVAGAVGADVARFRADFDAGVGRDEVARDYEAALEAGVNAIPAVIFPATGRALVGLADLATYRAAVDEAAGA